MAYQINNYKNTQILNPSLFYIIYHLRLIFKFLLFWNFQM